VNPVRHYDCRIEIGLVGPHPQGSAVSWEIRTLFTDAFGGIVEDPITGSFNASVAQWLFETGRVTTGYRAAQGSAIRRRGRIEVEFASDTGQAWIGGKTLTIAEGSLPVLAEHS
jgi:predicted PhzF superfamily epimerase YddE/YHI9